jgi:hypothetical protein
MDNWLPQVVFDLMTTIGTLTNLSRTSMASGLNDDPVKYAVMPV